MIAPIRELDGPETEERPMLSDVARAAASRLLPRVHPEAAAPSIPPWQAWLLVIWLVATASAYVAITLGLWKG